jgi:hypothetical protein
MAAAKYGNPQGRDRAVPGLRCLWMPARDQRLLLGAALATSALLLLAASAGHADLLAYGAPLFLLAVPLLAGRYVGEDRLERMRSSIYAPRRRQPRAATPPACHRLAATALPRGGRLIAHSLAKRPPPALAAS